MHDDRCTCAECEHEEVHAHLDLTCSDSGESFRVRVPKAHRHDSIGWAGRDRLQWDGPDGEVMTGVEVTRGAQGITAHCTGGKRHRLRHGQYRPWQPTDVEEDMAKGEDGDAPKPSTGGGERWITVHPNGKDEKGVPVMITQNKDKTWRIIGGAGGKLNHLRLKNVKSKEEYAAQAKEKRKEQSGKEKERKAGQSDEQKAKETKSKAAVKEERREAEREYIGKIRERLGGIDDDLDEEKLKGLSDGAKGLLLSRHHAKQLRQANERLKLAQTEVVGDKVSESRERALIESYADENPDLADEARMMASEQLHLAEVEKSERKAERAARRTRTARSKPGEEALAKTVDMIMEAQDPESELRTLGGRDDEGPALKIQLSASDELRRRSLQELADAQALVHAAETIGEGGFDAESKAVKQVLKSAGVDPEGDPEGAAEALKAEAARKYRRHEIARHRSEHMGTIEVEEGEEKARAKLAYSDLLSGIAKTAKAAKEMGLTDTERVPVKDATVAEFIDLMQEKEKLKAKQEEFKRMNAAIERGDYDRSRRAFDLAPADLSDKVLQSVEDQVRTALTKDVLSVADQRSADHVQAVANGHFAGLADVTLGITRERLINRATQDALGLANTSMIVRYAMEQSGHDGEKVLAALESVHVERLKTMQSDALAKVEALAPGLQATVSDVGSIEQAVQQLDLHEQDLADAQRAVGAAIGKLEATATLSQTFRQPLPESMTLDLGDTGLDGTLKWLHASGLQTGDYKVDYSAKTVDIPQAAWSKLVSREPESVVKARELADEIKAGKHDEDGWLPSGIVTRERSAYTDPTPETPYHHEPVDTSMTGDALAANLMDHVGSRLAMGESPQDIQQSLRDPVLMGKARDIDAYTEQIKKLFPLHDDDGEIRKADFFREHYDKIANDYMERKHPGEGAFHSQSIDVDDPETHEATFRTLAANPRTRWAFTPHGELPPEGRAEIREHFYEKMGIADTRSYTEQYDKAVAELGPEPDKDAGTMSMFGGPAGPSGEWKQWKADAMKIAQQYPGEGRELFNKLHGEKPKRDVSPRLTPEVQAALDDVLAENPWASTAHAADTVRERLGLSRDQVRGEDVHNYRAPERWQVTKDKFDRLSRRSATPWAQYVTMHGSLESATQAIQDELKGQFAEKFHEHHAQLTGKPLQQGKAEVSNREKHIFATSSPEEHEEFRREQAERMALLQQRDDSGKYADMGGTGALLDAEAESRRQDTAAAQAQGGMFGAPAAAVQEQPSMGLFGAPPEPPKPKRPEREPLRNGERMSLGDRAEAQLGSVVRRVGGQVKGDKATKLFTVDMSGDRVHQQRAIKMFRQNGGRLGAWLGTGTGKTLAATGASTDVIDAGEAPHALHLVPVAVQSQFDGEMLRFTDPGKYKWQTADGMSHDERVALLKNPDAQIRVMTHQSYRETMLRVMADHHGRDTEQMANDLRKSDPETAATWMREALDAAGIDKGMVYVDEAHMATSQQEEGSLLDAIVGAATHPKNATHYLAGSATPAKNTEKEMFSHASRLDPERYGDRAKFMANFGQDAQFNPEAIRRELSHLTYSAKIEPKGVDRHTSDNPMVRDGKKSSEPLQLSTEHQAHVDKVRDAYKAAKEARGRGGVDVEAMKVLSPASFAEAPESEHEKIARTKMSALGMIRDHALRRAINQAPPEINTKLQRLADVIEHDVQHGEWTDSVTGESKKGKPSIVFSDSKREVQMIRDHLAERGIRVAAYTGSLNTAQREDVRNGFNPEKGEAQYDVVVATSAAEAGVNMQRGRVVHHFDVPQTQKSWTQRSGRAYRQGATGDVEVHNWHSEDEYDQAGLRRLRRKEGLANVFETPLGAMDERGIALAYQRQLQRDHGHRDTETELLRAAK